MLIDKSCFGKRPEDLVRTGFLMEWYKLLCFRKLCNKKPLIGQGKI